MKWVMYLVLLIVGVVCWMMFMKKGTEIRDMEQKIAQVEDIGDPDEELPA
jgi:hypothetical protein